MKHHSGGAQHAHPESILTFKRLQLELTVMKNPRLSGYIASALVPYNADLSINEQEYVKHLKEISKADRLCAVYVNALVGEVFSLEPDERRRLLTLARQNVPREI